MKKNQDLQVLVNQDFEKFIIIERYNNTSKIISPFIKFADQYISDICIPINRSHRVKKLQSIVPEFCTINQISNELSVDCCKNIENEMFNGINDGFIMLNVSLHDQNIEGIEKNIGSIYEADDILILKNCIEKYQSVNVDIKNDKTVFKTKGLKVLPVILYDGFLLCITNNHQSIMYMSIQHPKKKIIGKCSKTHSFKIVNFYLNLWPIFDIDIKNKATIKLNIDFDFDETTPIIIKMTKKNNSNQIKIQKIFETV